MTEVAAGIPEVASGVAYGAQGGDPLQMRPVRCDPSRQREPDATRWRDWMPFLRRSAVSLPAGPGEMERLVSPRWGVGRRELPQRRFRLLSALLRARRRGSREVARGPRL